MVPIRLPQPHNHITVILDGKVIASLATTVVSPCQWLLTVMVGCVQVLGSVSIAEGKEFSDKLRMLKVDSTVTAVPHNLEIVYTPTSNYGLYSGLLPRHPAMYS